MHKKQKTSIVWFTNNLRTKDNNLLKSASDNSDFIIGVYCIDFCASDITYYGFKKTNKFRAKFLLQTLNSLKKELNKLNIPLIILYKQYKNKFISTINEFKVTSIYVQKEWTRDEIMKIDSIKKIIPNNVKFNEIYDQFLYDPSNIPFSFKNIPDIFTNFRKELEKKGEIIPLVNINKKPKSLTVKNDLKIPSLEELGYEDFELDNRTAFPFEGGEINAIERLNEYLFKTKLIGNYKNTRNGLLGTNYSSKFSPWLANGSLSARQIFKNVKDFEIKYFSNQSTYWMVFELIWRDFFKYVSLKHKNKIFKLNGILNIEYNWSTNKKYIDQWINGTTSNDFVNANMIELKSTGWMSNRGRQNVASYFAKNMKMDWRIGASYFESMLIDYDVHSNYGNWIYVSGVGNDPRDRFFNLKRQAEIYDGDRKFRKKWL